MSVKITEMYRQRLRMPYKNRYAWGTTNPTYPIEYFNGWDANQMGFQDGKVYIKLRNANDIAHSGRDLSNHPETKKRIEQLARVESGESLGYVVWCYVKDKSAYEWEIKDVDGEHLYKIEKLYTDLNGNVVAICRKEVLNWCKAS
jgi:outer membrane protein assembly factor BamB